MIQLYMYDYGYAMWQMLHLSLDQKGLYRLGTSKYACKEVMGIVRFSSLLGHFSKFSKQFIAALELIQSHKLGYLVREHIPHFHLHLNI